MEPVSEQSQSSHEKLVISIGTLENREALQNNIQFKITPRNQNNWRMQKFQTNDEPMTTTHL